LKNKWGLHIIQRKNFKIIPKLNIFLYFIP
jgi:hypothetical protein